MMKKKQAMAFVFLLLFFAPALLAEEETKPTLFIEADNLGYVKNMEGSNFAYRTTRTLFGDLFRLNFLWKKSDKVEIRAGAVALKPFNEMYLQWGDYHGGHRYDNSLARGPLELTEYDRNVPLLMPFVQFIHHGKHMDFIFGNLQKDHPYHQLVKYDVYEFMRSTETGIQLLFNRSSSFYQEFYINWELTNKINQRENFHIGSISRFMWGASSLGFELFYLHRGGEEYPQKPLVSENIAASLPLFLGKSFAGPVLKKAGVELVALVVLDEPDRTRPSTWTLGYGGLGSLLVQLGGVELKAGYWRGRGVYAEEGIPFTQSPQYIYAEGGGSIRLEDNVDINIRFVLGLFGNRFADSFFDQKLSVRWRGEFAIN